MCTAPLYIKNNSVYKSYLHSFKGYEVPCGRCDECRNTYISDWRTRISFELSNLYSRGGCAVFLTFTYDNEHLPLYTDGNFSIHCFNHKDVKAFLNRLKVSCYRAFGANSYKYFFTSEYGKTTCRPHYHGLFFLQPYVDYVMFTELARSVWSYGFMFPKYDIHQNKYVDNYGSISTPLIRSLVGGAKYVSKYVTKDLSFYDLPSVSSYISDKDNKDKMRPYLPKHWQSNLLGLSILDSVNQFDSVSVERVLNDGIVNPLTFDVVSCPRFIINKLLYKNVKSNRISPTTGKYLYDRYLSDFGRKYMHSIFKSRAFKFANKISEVLQIGFSDPMRFNLCGIDVNRLRSIGLTSQFLPQDCLPLSVYHLFWKMASTPLLKSFLSRYSGDVCALYDIDKVFPFWLKAKDTEYLKKHSSDYLLRFDNVYRCDDSLYNRLFSDFAMFHDVFKDISISLSLERTRYFNQKQDEVDTFKKKYFSRFDPTLC